MTIASAGHRGLFLVPTRELAIQVHRSRGMTPQRDALRRGVDIVVATPGRLIDHLQQRSVDLTGVLTLDEAGRMLDL